MEPERQPLAVTIVLWVLLGLFEMRGIASRHHNTLLQPIVCPRISCSPVLIVSPNFVIFCDGMALCYSDRQRGFDFRYLY